MLLRPSLIKEDVTHLLRSLMIKSNGRSNGNEWAVHTKHEFRNVLVVEHKCKNSLPINAASNYKRRKHQKPKVRSITHKKKTLRNHSLLIFSLESFSLIDLSIGGGLVDATPMHYSSTQFILQVFHLQRQSHSQHHPSATTRSSIVDFLHHQSIWQLRYNFFL